MHYGFKLNHRLVVKFKFVDSDGSGCCDVDSGGGGGVGSSSSSSSMGRRNLFWFNYTKFVCNLNASVSSRSM